MSYAQTVTPYTLITLALKMTGVAAEGQTPSNEMVFDSFTILNMMLSQWQVRRWLVYSTTDTACLCTGAQSYTVETGGDFDVPRPDRIEAAFMRYYGSAPQPLDYDLILIQAREEYNLIQMKQLTTWPTHIYYDSDLPIARVWPWPIPPDNSYELHITTKERLQQFLNLNDTIALPAEYQDAIVWNLAVRLRPMFQLPPDPTTQQMAAATLATIRTANTQLPRARMPDDFRSIDQTRYNVYADESY